MIRIRPGEPSDLPMIMAFDLLPGDRIAEIMERRILVADDNGVIAYLAWQHGGCIGRDYVNKLVVEEAHRRRGVASLLLDRLYTILKGRVFISAGAESTAGLALIVNNGWTEAGRIKGLHDKEGEEVFFYRDF